MLNTSATELKKGAQRVADHASQVSVFLVSSVDPVLCPCPGFPIPVAARTLRYAVHHQHIRTIRQVGRRTLRSGHDVDLPSNRSTFFNRKKKQKIENIQKPSRVIFTRPSLSKRQGAITVGDLLSSHSHRQHGPLGWNSDPF